MVNKDVYIFVYIDSYKICIVEENNLGLFCQLPRVFLVLVLGQILLHV